MEFNTALLHKGFNGEKVPFSSHHLCTVSPLLFCAWIWADHSVRRNSFFTVANVVFIIFICIAVIAGIAAGIVLVILVAV